MIRSFPTLILIAVLFIQCQKTTQFSSGNSLYNVEIIVDGLDIAWGMCFLPDGSMLISEQDGRLIHFKDGEKTEVKGVPDVFYENQGGLLDLEIHPNYSENGWIYLTYSMLSEHNNEESTLALMRAHLKDGQLINQEILYITEPYSNWTRH